MAHQPVHDERRADHVAGRFQYQDEQEQDQDLGKEDDHRAHPGEDSVDDERAEEAGGKHVGDHGTGGDGRGLERVGGRGAPREHRLEHDEQDRREDDRPGNGMEQQPVEPVGDPANRGFADDGAERDVAGAALKCEAVVAGAGAGADFAGGKQHGVELPQQRVDAALADGDGFDDGDAEFGLKLRRVELEPVAFRQVDHVERDHHRQPELDQLQRQAEVIVEVGSVDHHQQRIGKALALLLAEQDIAGDGLVGAGRI